MKEHIALPTRVARNSLIFCEDFILWWFEHRMLLDLWEWCLCVMRLTRVDFVPDGIRSVTAVTTPDGEIR